MKPVSTSTVRISLVLLGIFFLLKPLPLHACPEKGPAFFEPGRTMEMNDGWRGQPIVHENEEYDLAITLDQHIYPALLPLINKFAAREKIKILVNEGTCGISAGKLARKQVEIGGFCCPPGTTDRLPDLRYHTLGIVGLALLVHPDNPVTTLTLDQARNIFTGEIRRWSEVLPARNRSAHTLPILPIARLHCKQRPGHWRLLLDNEKLFAPDTEKVGSIADMLALVVDSRYGIVPVHALRKTGWRFNGPELIGEPPR